MDDRITDKSIVAHYNGIMEAIVKTLRLSDTLNHIWVVMVWLCALYLLILGVMSLTKPNLIRRFLGRFATSPGANMLEAGLRLLAGIAFMGASPDMEFELVVFFVGAMLAVSAIAIAFLFRLHQWYASWAVGFARRILPVYGVLSITLGLVIAWALTH